MTENTKETRVAPKARPIVSLRARDGAVVEMLFREDRAECVLAVFRNDAVAEERTVRLDGHEYRPYSAENNLLTHRVVLLPSAAIEYGSDDDLLAEVTQFIHRYVDVSPAFEEVCAHYVLLTWGYDTFNELPYLRVRGDYGSGKSRFLLTVGSLCYKPIFASGASTVSPIFRLIDEIGGTLVVDEADFLASDERAEIIKILNNGNARGFPVLRSEVTPSKEFSPRAFNIFGPKLVATRHPFQDAALESRCLTEVLGNKAIRSDVPISLPRRFDSEAQALRNKLLMYRYRRFATVSDAPLNASSGLAPRRAQILAPVLAVATTKEARQRLRAFVGDHAISNTGEFEAEQRVLAAAKALMTDEGAVLTLKAVAKRFDEDWGEEYGVEAASRWVGAVLRRLGVELHKSNGLYIVPMEEYPRLRRLFVEYGLRDFGDPVDVNDGAMLAA